MIEGITVLKQYNVFMSIGLIIFLSVLFGIIAFLLVTMLPGQNLLSLNLAFGAIVGLIFFVSMKSDNSSPCYHYDVIIDDSVSVNELYKDYEILKVEGKIYTITLREK